MTLNRHSWTECVFPLVDCLVRAEAMPGIGPDRTWFPGNPFQDALINRYYAVRSVLNQFPEIKGMASRNVDVLNAFLRENGATIQLNDLDPGGFGVVSIMKVVVKWLTAGTPMRVKHRASNEEFDGFRLNNGVEFARSSEHPNPIAVITTQSGDIVYVTELDWTPKGPFDLTEFASRMTQRSLATFDHSGVEIPMVDLHHQPDISDLIGLFCNGDDGNRAIVRQALQYSTFKMNHLGAEAYSAAAIAVTRSRPMPILQVQGEFAVWVVRPGFKQGEHNTPVFTGYVTREHWKNPGDLNLGVDESAPMKLEKGWTSRGDLHVFNG